MLPFITNWTYNNILWVTYHSSSRKSTGVTISITIVKSQHNKLLRAEGGGHRVFKIRNIGMMESWKDRNLQTFGQATNSALELREDGVFHQTRS